MIPTTSPARLLRLTVLAGAVGLAAGGAAWALVHIIGLITNLALFNRWGWALPSFRDLQVGPRVVIMAVLGGLAVSLLAKWSPIIKGHGIPEAMESVLTRQSRVAPRAAVAKPLSAALAIGTGGPFGAEGPIIVTGGALGSLLGQVVHVSASERKVLLASGAAAGMAATFGSPLAAVALAIELLLFEFSARAFVPLVVATSVAGAVHAALFGSGPLFSVPAHHFAGLGQLPLFIPLGLLCGLLAVVIARGLFAVEGLYRRLPVSEFWHPIIGAAAFATVGLAVPRALGVGYDAIDDALAGRLALATLAGLALGKLIVWWLALASGTSGGTLAPILLISACTGGFVGHVAASAFPGLGISPGAWALVAMAATFGAATRAPFAAIVFVFELTRDYNAVLPLMLATVLADLVARALLTDSIMTEKLSRRGLRVPDAYHPDVLATTMVAEVMTTQVLTVPEGATAGEAMDLFRAGGHSAYPIVDGDGRCVGIVSRGDLLAGDLDPDVPVGDTFSRPVVSVPSTATALDALTAMLDEEVDHLPVLDGDLHLEGICTRTDILQARRRQLRAERPEPGWLGQRRLAG
ncbi:MAG TPA: chloride channel protein [Acidimicrobiales bacterium]|nr:chloride channel protein [Acidimicrobiales bacterium]